MTGRISPARVFGIPAAIAAASVAGLIAGLNGDNAYDLLAWAGLACPIAATAWAWRHRHRA